MSREIEKPTFSTRSFPAHPVLMQVGGKGLGVITPRNMCLLNLYIFLYPRKHRMKKKCSGKLKFIV